MGFCVGYYFVHVIKKTNSDSVLNAVRVKEVLGYLSTVTHCPSVRTKKSLSYIASACIPGK